MEEMTMYSAIGRAMKWLALGLFAIGLAAAHAQAPRTINYQGFLTNNAGVAVNTPVNLTLRLYDPASQPANLLLWSETQSNVVVTSGVFNVVLGAVTPFPASVVFDRSYSLGVTVNSDAEMTPRQLLNAVPYANRATVANALAAGANVGADNTLPCDSARAGNLRWNAGAGAMQACDGTGWKTLSFSTFTVGGNISGLTGTLVLQNNLTNNLSIAANGSFYFTTSLPAGSPYSVTVLTQPAGQTCTVTNGTGTLASANITNVSVNCVAGVTANLTVANYLSFCSVSVNGAAPSTAVTRTVPVAAGSVVSLVAAPISGFFFSYWVGTADDTTAAHDTQTSTSVTVNADKTVQACCSITPGGTCP
jgi:hypothetical protein